MKKSLGVLLVSIFMILWFNQMMIASFEEEQQSSSLETPFINKFIALADISILKHHADSNILIGNDENPLLIFRGESRDLRFAKIINWVTQLSIIDEPTVANENAFVLDQYGNPVICYSDNDGSAENLKVTQPLADSDEWETNRVHTSGSTGIECDMAIDSEGFFHISHFQWNGATLLYTTNKSGAWETIQIAEDASWQKTAIEIDSEDGVHIIYGFSGQLFHAFQNGANWDTEYIDSGDNPEATIDDNNNLHITYDKSGDLYYGTNDSDSWVSKLVINDIEVGRDHYITLDNKNAPYISYRDAIKGGLYYAFLNNEDFTTELVDKRFEAGRSNSIAIDQAGFIHISYRYDTGNWSILEAVWTNNNGEIFAAGHQGIHIAHYYDGKWHEVTIPDFSANFYDVFGFGDDVYIVGSLGTLVHYDGTQWEKLSAGPLSALHGVWVSPSGLVYTVGGEGSIYQYNGVTFEPMTSNTSMTLKAVWGIDDNHIFAVGVDGTILHYDGNSWSEMNSGTSKTLQDVLESR